MKHEGIYTALTHTLTPLKMKLLLLLEEGPHTKSQMYEKNPTTNNGIVREALDDLQLGGFTVGGQVRGAPYRLSVQGAALVNWMMEGAILV